MRPPELRAIVKDEKSGKEIVVCIGPDVPFVVIHRSLARAGWTIDKRKLRRILKEARTSPDSITH